MRKKFKYMLVSLILVALVFGIILSGCSSKQSSKQSEKPKKQTKVVEEDGEESVSKKGERKVLMLGRSVMWGWFEHWGSDGSSPVKREGFILYYRELEVPPEIAGSTRDYVDEFADKKPIVFFKFCFDDFWASSPGEVKENLAENKKYIEQVYDIVVKEKGLKLIIGNALPKVRVYTDANLVRTEREFNSWLRSFAKRHSGEIYIFDQYSILSDRGGNLKTRFAQSPEDSHLNDKAYSALDDSFFKLLKDNF